MQAQNEPILLFDNECGVCRHIAHWVRTSAQDKSGNTTIIVHPIGDDPERLWSLNPELDIWNAYATIHVLMPDGSMKLGGEAVAEVLRSLPKARWFTWVFAVSLFGFRPFQKMLDLSYTILADVRPLFGCESCGTPSWVKPIKSLIKRIKALFGAGTHPRSIPHFTSLSAKDRRPLPASGEIPPHERSL